MAYAGGEGRFYEAYYLICNDPARGLGFWFRYTLLNPLDRHAASGPCLWAAFCDRERPERNLALKRSTPGGAIAPGPEGLGLTVGDAAIGDRTACGALEQDGRSIEWDLAWDGELNEYAGVHPAVARLTKKHVGVKFPYLGARFSGRVSVDGERIDLDRLWGHQAHHWGRGQTTFWSWGYACEFPDEPGATLFVLKPSFARGRVSPVLCYPRMAGRQWMLWDPRGTGRAEGDPPEQWTFEARSARRRARMVFAAEPDTTLGFTYHTPNYATTVCRNSPLCRVDTTLWERTHPLASWREVVRRQGWGTAEVARPE